MRIFVASSYEDLQNHREAATRAILTSGNIPLSERRASVIANQRENTSIPSSFNAATNSFRSVWQKEHVIAPLSSYIVLRMLVPRFVPIVQHFPERGLPDVPLAVQEALCGSRGAAPRGTAW